MEPLEDGFRERVGVSLLLIFTVARKECELFGAKVMLGTAL
jgi:hypothetical protein